MHVRSWCAAAVVSLRCSCARRFAAKPPQAATSACAILLVILVDCNPILLRASVSCRRGDSFCVRSENFAGRVWRITLAIRSLLQRVCVEMLELPFPLRERRQRSSRAPSALNFYAACVLPGIIPRDHVPGYLLSRETMCRVIYYPARPCGGLSIIPRDHVAGYIYSRETMWRVIYYPARPCGGSYHVAGRAVKRGLCIKRVASRLLHNGHF